MSKVLFTFTQIFPFPAHDDSHLTEENLKNGAKLLREAKKHEEIAIQHLETAFKAWI